MHTRIFRKSLFVCLLLIFALDLNYKPMAQTQTPPPTIHTAPESIESQTIRARQRGDSSPGHIPTREELGLPTQIGLADTTIQIYLLTFDPYYLDGRPLTIYAEWNDPHVLTDMVAQSLQNSSNNQYGFHVMQAVTVRDYPLRNDGTKLDNEAYEPCRLAFLYGTEVPSYCSGANRDDPLAFSPQRNLQAVYDPGFASACEALRTGQADEVWIWGMPGANASEWYIEDPASICPGATRQFAIMMFNYERGLAQALHSFGHRAEFILQGKTNYPVPQQVINDFYDGFTGGFTGNLWRYEPPYDDYFTCPPAPDSTHPEVDVNDTHAGNVHNPPNAYCHYQYDRDQEVWSDADDWKVNYPNLTGQKNLINRGDWNCPASGDCQSSYLLWWFNHLPNRPTEGSSYINWWEYIFFTAWRIPANVIDKQPTPNQHTAPETTAVAITYDLPMDITTVNRRSFAVYGMQGGQAGVVDIIYNVDGGVIRKLSSQPFHPGELVQVSATVDTLTAFGGRPASPTVWQFRTQAAAAPGILGVRTDYATGRFPLIATLGDIDGDGDLDALVVNADQDTLSVLQNNGDGTFATKVDYATGNHPISVAMGDVDNDNDLDALVVNAFDDTLSVLKNNGDGIFATRVNYWVGDMPGYVSVGDIDGDGDLDALVSNRDSDNLSVLKNNGSGALTVRVNYGAGNQPRFVALGDVDDDGDLDAFVTNERDDNLSLFKNNGDGTFAARVNYAVGNAPLFLALGDLDADTDLDVLVSNSDSDTVSVLENNGNGAFAAKTDYAVESGPIVVNLGDMDGDSDLDALVANIGADNVSLLKNNGSGTFAAQVSYAVGSAPYSVALGDVDGDGDLDALVSNRDSNTVSVLRNMHPPALVSGKQPAPNQHTAPINTTVAITYSEPINAATVNKNTFAVYGMQTGLLEGTYSVDGGVIRLAPDQLFHPGELVQVSATTGTLTLLGGSPFPSAWQFRTEVSPSVGVFAPEANYDKNEPYFVTVGDVDGDGDLDALVLSANLNYLSVFKNNGDGSLAAPLEYATGDWPKAAALGDIDGDGYPDALVANYGASTMSVLKNNGDGTFAPKVDYTTASSNYNPVSIALADIECDGDLDALVVNYNSNTLSVLENNGDGTFVARVDYVTGDVPYSVDLSDLDGDGDLDALVANSHWLSSTLSIFKNAGDGTFATRVDYAAGERSQYIATGDLDGDGDPDALVVNAETPTLSVFKNDGDGVLAAPMDYATGKAPWAVAIGDIDGDSDLDALVTNRFSDTLSVFKNYGDGTLAPREDYIPGDFPMSVAMGDMDGDGDLDALVTNRFSNTLSIMRNTTIPGAPSDLGVATASSTQVNLAWTDNCSNEDGFKIERSLDRTSSWVQIATVGANVTSYTDTGLSRNTVYYYRIRAYNAGGDTVYSNPISVATWANEIYIPIMRK